MPPCLPFGVKSQCIGYQTTTMQNTQLVDIGAVIASKSGRPWPRPIVWTIERLIHQNEINTILSRYGHLRGAAFMAALVDYFSVSVSWHNPADLPQSSRCIFVCNHPLGAFDGICISHLIHNRYGNVRYIVNDLLYHLEPLRPIFLPVNKFGRQARESVEMLDEAMQSDLPVVTFPAGICSRLIDGRIQDLPWAKSFVQQSIRYNRPIVPLFFSGRNSRSFYRIERWRKALGIRFNLGTALLPHEMFGVRGKSFEIFVGKPITPEELSRDKRPAIEIAQDIRRRVYMLDRTRPTQQVSNPTNSSHHL